MSFYYDVQRNILLYPQSSLFAHVTNELEGAKPVNGEWVAVPRNLHNSQTLRYFNYPTPPIMTEYDWPIKRGWKAMPHQKLMANFMVLHPRCFNLSDMGCVDCETEYLSPTGWKRIDQYDGGKVAQYHKDGRAEFIQPTEYVVYPCEKMLRFRSFSNIDQKLSKEHRVVWLDANNQLKVCSAEYILRRQQQTKWGWNGKFITTFRGGQEGIPLSNAELRVMVAVIADGCFASRTTKWCRIQVKKLRKIERIRQLLTNASISFEEKRVASRDGVVNFKFNAPRRERELKDFYWACSFSQLQIIADECIHWDGSKAKAGATLFSSASKNSADFIQWVFAATGRTATLKEVRRDKRSWFIVYAAKKALTPKLCGNSNGVKSTPITLEPTIDGKKYCFEVPTNMLILRRNGRIFITGNTMKTLSTLWSADWLMNQHPKGSFRALIVAPLSTLQRVWGDALFNNFFGRRSFTILHGSSTKRLAGLDQDVDFYIVNFDGVGVGAHTRRRFELDGFSAELAGRRDIRLAIVDECSAYKMATTKRHRIARLVFGQKDYLWLLTGTPTAHAPTDAYGLGKLVNNAYGKSFTTFQAETMIKVSQFKWVPQKDGYEKAGRLLQPSIRFALEDVWDGPEMTTQQRQVALTPQQTKLLSDLKNSLQVTLKSGKQITAMNEAAARQKALQIILGGVYDENHKTHLVDVDPRLREIKDLIEEAPGKLLIFAEFRNIVELLTRELKKITSVGMVHGDVHERERSVLFQNFQLSEHPRVLCAHPGTMAHGLDLWRAQTIIWYGPVDSTEIYLQANRRAYRPGQKFPVSIVQLVATKLERGIFQRLETNESMQGVLLDLIKRNEL